jgi:hypothetical protein
MDFFTEEDEYLGAGGEVRQSAILSSLTGQQLPTPRALKEDE